MSTQQQVGRAVLEARSVSKRYGGVTAVRDVSLAVHEGEVRGLIGPNGAGKTTLFDVLSGAQTASAGQVLLDGQDVTGRSATWRSRHGIRRTFQRQQPFSWLSVEDNLMVALEWRGGGGGVVADMVRWPLRVRHEKARRARVGEVLELLGLSDMRQASAGSLTIGHARLVEMGRAIVDHPRVLLLDEPTSGLGEEEVERLGAAVRRIRADEGCAVVLVEHDVGFVMRECDRVVVLDLGAVLAEGTPDEVQGNPAVAEAYLGSRT